MSTYTSTGIPPFVPATVNTTIDKVVFQIEHLSGQINELTSHLDVAAGEVSTRGKQTFQSIKLNFNNDTVVNFNYMVDVISDKTRNWPLTELIIVAIVALIFLITGICYLAARTGEKVVARKYQKQLIQV
ncbi:unnamed protein product [Auanema sp. JU1783]|nr:unnamed protein product [Auanema sp. JU1783]